jgi:hypothetical protein
MLDCDYPLVINNSAPRLNTSVTARSGSLPLQTTAAERRPELKVLYTTGAGITDGMRARFVQNWAFLPKPYTVDQLQVTLSVRFGIGPKTNRPAP